MAHQSINYKKKVPSEFGNLLVYSSFNRLIGGELYYLALS